MNNYFYISVKIGKTDFYIRQVTWFKNFEPTFEPQLVTNHETAGLFFADQVKRILEKYPDAKILTKNKIGNKIEFIEVEKSSFTR